MVVDNAGFEERLKIACFRGITSQLLERNLITPDELRKINKHLEKLETDLIGAKPRNLERQRKLINL